MRRSFFDLPLRFQIIIPFSLLIIVLTAVVVGFGLPLAKQASSEKLDLKLDSSRAVFLQLLDGETNELKRMAALEIERPEVRQALTAGDHDRVSQALEVTREPLDALQITSASGADLGASGGKTPLTSETIIATGHDGATIAPSAGGQMLLAVQAIGPPEAPTAYLAAGRLLSRLLPSLKPSGSAEVAAYQDGSLIATTFATNHGKAPEVSLQPAELTAQSGPIKKGHVVDGEGYGAVYDRLPGTTGMTFAVFVPRSEAGPSEELVAGVLAGTVGIALVLLVLGFAIATAIAARMERVVETIDRIGGGNFQQRVHLQSNDEVGHLAQVVDRMAARLQQAEAEKGEFLGMASHELKTPIALIGNATEVLLDEAAQQDEDGTRRELLQIIAGNTERLKRRVADLLDLARLEAGHLALHPRPVDLLPLLREAAEGIRPMLAPRNQALSLELPPSLPPVEADPDRLQQVLLNLLSNAARHTPERTSIAVRAHLNGRGVIVDVEDDGQGLPDEKLQRLLDTRRRAFSGEGGLGLLITQRLVALHKGRMWGKSEVGRGTTFSFSLPVAAKEGDAK